MCPQIFSILEKRRSVFACAQSVFHKREWVVCAHFTLLRMTGWGRRTGFVRLFAPEIDKKARQPSEKSENWRAFHVT